MLPALTAMVVGAGSFGLIFLIIMNHPTLFDSCFLLPKKQPHCYNP